MTVEAEYSQGRTCSNSAARTQGALVAAVGDETAHSAHALKASLAESLAASVATHSLPADNSANLERLWMRSNLRRRQSLPIYGYLLLQCHRYWLSFHLLFVPANPGHSLALPFSGKQLHTLDKHHRSFRKSKCQVLTFDTRVTAVLGGAGQSWKHERRKLPGIEPLITHNQQPTL